MVVQQIRETKETLEHVQSKDMNWDNLLEATDHLLDSLMEHFDVCDNVIRTFVEHSDDKKYKDAQKLFKAATTEYRKHIGTVVNYIKHRQGALRAIAMLGDYGVCLGYLVEGPVHGVGLGPAAEVHVGQDTAFSFNRDLRFNLCGIFSMGAVLATALHGIGRTVSHKPFSLPAPSDWVEGLTAVATLDEIFYPDEVLKPVPVVAAKANGFVVQFPGQRARPTRADPTRVLVAYRGDGATRMYKMPYLGETARRWYR